MPSNNDSGGNRTRPSIDYADFYDLLNVSQEASEREIQAQARQMLAKFHPDVSDHPHAEEIYKSINRAEDVLTDSGQRVLYESLGHEQYIRRREQGDILNAEDVEKAARQRMENQQGGGGVKQSSAANKNDSRTRQTDTSRAIGSSLSSAIGYQSINELTLERTPAEWVSRTYSQIWTFRLLLVTISAILLYYVGNESPETLLNFWESIGIFTEYGIGVVIVCSIFLVAMLITLVTGFFGNYRLKDIEQLQAEVQEQKQEKSVSNDTSSRRFNIAERDQGRGDSWESPGELGKQSSEGSYQISEDAVLETPRGIIHSKRLLMLGLIITIIGSYADGLHPWEHLHVLLSGGSIENNLWLDVGSEGAEAVVVLLNAALVFILFIAVISGMLWAVHSMSKDVWKQWYLYNGKAQPAVWDALIVTVITAFSSGLALGETEIHNFNPGNIHPSLATITGADPVTTLISTSIIAVLVMYVLLAVYQRRRRWGRGKG